MKRTLAVLGAIGLIAAAFLVRGLLDGDIDFGGGGGGGNSSQEELTVVCVSELRPVCDAIHAADDEIEVRVEEAQTTLDSLLSADFDPAAADFDAWLTVTPYPAQVEEQRARALPDPALGEPSAVLARSPLTLVGWNERLGPLTEACGEPVTWKCVGEQAGLPWAAIGGDELWGAVKPGQADPAMTATGLLTISQATASWFGGSNFASNDFSEPGFKQWFTQLEQNGVPYYPAPPLTPLDEMLTKGPSTFDISGSIEALSAARVKASRDKDRLTLLYPEPMVTADVVLVPIIDSGRADEVDDLASSDELRTALLDNGWRVLEQPLPASADPNVTIPDTNGLPAPGVVEALRTLWLEVT